MYELSASDNLESILDEAAIQFVLYLDPEHEDTPLFRQSFGLAAQELGSGARLSQWFEVNVQANALLEDGRHARAITDEN